MYYSLAGELLLHASSSVGKDREKIARGLGVHARQLHIAIDGLEATVVCAATFKVSCAVCRKKIECSCGTAGLCECVEAQAPQRVGSFDVEDHCIECFRRQDERESPGEGLEHPLHQHGALEQHPRRARGKKAKAKRAREQALEEQCPFAVRAA